MRPAPIVFFALFGIFTCLGFQSAAQCPETGVNESLYGTNGWNGYVYDDVGTFSNFLGTKNELTEFNETFASGETDGGCAFPLETFSVRFKNRQDFSCGLHTFTVTSNNVARLSIDGGATFLISITSGTGNASVHLTGGKYDLVLEYVHNTGSPQISFDFDATPGDHAGVVSGDQVICESPADPVAFTSLSPARFCSEDPVSYQWEVSVDGGAYTVITGATNVNYDVPSGITTGNYLYRRRATDGVTTIWSNDISVVVDVPQGNQTAFGSTSWMGYAYEGADNYTSSDYLGYFEESAPDFTETFDAVAMNGCDLPAEGFTVRLKRQETIATCEGYDISVQAQGGGVRLYVDGLLVINAYDPVASLETHSVNLLLNPGTHLFILEYYNNTGANFLQYNQTATGITAGGGVIGTDQIACGAPYNPVPFTSIKAAEFCSGTPTYQWQSAPSESGPWADISGAQSAAFDEASALGIGTYYYRRAATVGGTTVYSNVVEVDVKQPAGDEVTYGSGSWIAYAYNGFNNFSSSNYLGFFNVAALNFTEDFSAVSLTGCDLPNENFSVRFRREEALPCGGYDITLTGDDQVRLFLDGVQLTNGYTTNYSGNIFLDGLLHRFVIEFTDASGPKNVAFSITAAGTTSSGGQIGYSQDICSVARDPAAFVSLVDAGFCSGTTTYEWQIANDPGGPWTPLAGTNSPTYNSPALTPPGVYYFRRMATDGVAEVFSNVLEVSAFTAMGDQVSYGDNKWIGYVYDEEADWTTNYKGYMERPTNFDESFCAGVCEFLPDFGCPVVASGFSVHFKNRVDFECGSYLITVGGDDGVRLVVDGVIVPEFDKLTPHGYTTYSKIMYFDGTPDTELELLYFESGGGNRVSFSAVFLGPGDAGTIGGDQYSCETGITPGMITNVTPATTCPGASTISYQWQYSLDGLGWVDIMGETGLSYTPTDPIDVTHYYRRQVTIDGEYTWPSNVITVAVDPPQGDQVTYGQNQWIGYVYTGFQDADPWDPGAYQGYMIQQTNFDTPFCGPSCMQAINGCDFLTDNFSIRFLNEMTLACGYYQITIGFNGGGRLFIDGNPVPGLNEYWIHDPYETLTATVLLTEGTHQFRYDYREDLFGNRVSFNIEYLRPGTPAVIGNLQVLCSAPYNPATIMQFGAGPVFECYPDPSPSHQWQVSDDEVNWSDIPLATSSSYTPPSNHTFTRYYRRKDTNDMGEELYSNVVSITYDPDGSTTDGSEFGTAPDWIAHVYDGADNFTSYQGSFIQTMVADAFDQSFCGGNCIFPIDGCDFLTETFTIRFRTQIDLVPGQYTFTIGSQGAARLTISGGELVSPLLAVDDYTPHVGYRTQSNGSPIELEGGTYSLELDYSVGFTGTRVSFSYTFTPLPVTWYYFNGYYADGKSFLEWHTASEINNEGFEVQHSTNGVHFASIGWVEGNGTTNVANEYRFVHEQPVVGWNYYRLKQVDYDGKFEYSRLIPVLADNLPRIEIYPNPLKDDRLFLSRINTDQPVQVTVTNMLGQDPFELAQDRMMPTCFIIPRRLAPGLYHVKIRMGEAVHTRKLIIE